MPRLFGPRGLLRSAYLGAAGLSVVAAAFPSDATTRRIKPTLMPLLLASSALFSSASNRQAVTNKPLDTGLLVAGLAGGWVGDIILMGKDSRSDDPAVRANNLNRGAAAFSINQLAYHALLIRSGARLTKKNVALRLPAIVSGIGLASIRNKTAMPAAAGYGTALATTSALAQDSRGVAALGGNLFVVSDGLILGRLTLLRNGSRTDALADGAVMATYVTAQLLLVDRIVDNILGGK